MRARANAIRLAGALLLALGILALAYRGFTYTKQTRETSLGPLKVIFKDRERVEVPVWLGATAAVAGGVLLGWGGRRRPRG